MERLPQTLYKSFKPVKLYLDDVEEIVEILQQTCPHVNISTKEYSLKDVKQLRDLKQEQIMCLYIINDEPHIRLDLEPSRTTLYSRDDELISRGLFEKIKQILEKRERKLASFLASMVILNIFGASFAGLLVFGLLGSNNSMIFLSIAFLTLGIYSLWYSFQINFNRHSIIVLKHQINAPSFWKRNSDKIILGILSAILGGLITIILFKVFGITP